MSINMDNQKQSLAKPEPEFKNAKELLYDKIPISVPALDIIIKVLFFAMILTLGLGLYFSR